MEVDGGIGLGGGNGQARGGAEDVIGREVFVLPDFLDAGLDAGQGAGAYDGHAVFALLGDLFQLLVHALARLRFLLQCGGHPGEFLADEPFDFIAGEDKSKLGL